jgi:hypothetical protein
MHLPDDVYEALEQHGVYRAPMSPVDGDREVAHHLCALIAIVHAFPQHEDSGKPRLSPAMRRIINDVQDALTPYFESTGEGVPDRLVQS